MYPKLAKFAMLFTAVFILSIPIGWSLGGEPDPGSLDYDLEVFNSTFSLRDLDIDTDKIRGRSFSTLSLDGCHISPIPGAPALPVVINPIISESEIDDVRLIREDPITVKLDHPVPCVQDPVPIDEDHLLGDSSQSLRHYDEDHGYPSDPLLWSCSGSKWKGGSPEYHYSMSISPVDYDPSTGKLTLYRSLEVVGNNDDTSEMETPTRQVHPPEALEPGTQLMIVCRDSYLDDLEDYADWKMQKGKIVTMVGFSVVEGAYSGSDEASKLWRFVHDSYFGDEENLENVLLVGEPTSTQVPSRMVKDLNPYGPAGEPSTLPADTYFACLGSPSSGPNIWNMDGDSNWGEVNDNDIGDYIPEVYVSRIAVSSDSRAEKWADKVMDYEKNPNLNSWVETAGLYGADTHQDTDGAVQCEYLWNNYLDTVYENKGAYYSDGVGGSTPLNAYNAIAGIDEGFSVLVYMGHGLRQYWSEGMQGSSRLIMDANQANSFTQSPEMPYITAMSCETNWFDGSYDSISEGFTENPDGGAIAYVGASRTTYGGIGYNQYTPGAPGIQEDVLRMINRGKRGSAEIFHEAKSHYVDQWQSYFKINPEPAFNAWMEHNLLGPAETEIWTSVPDTLTATFDYDRDYYSNVTVNVKDSGGRAVGGANVCFFVESTEKRAFSMVTDSLGKCTIPAVIEETAWATITVTKGGFVPFQEEFMVEDNTDPATEFSPVVGNPNGANGWYVSDPDIRFTASEPVTTYYRWNSGSKLTYKENVNTPLGENTLEFWSVDGSGNEERKNTLTVKYDPLVPESAVQVTPSEPDGNYNWYTTRPVIDVELPESKGAEQWVYYWWDRDEKQKSNGTIYAPDGDHTLHIQAMDGAGNREEEKEYDFRVDTRSPVTDFLTGGVFPNERGWYTTNFEITLRCDDYRATTSYRWDDGEWRDYSNPITPRSGNHTLYFRSEDTVGNVEETKEELVRYDIYQPSSRIEIDSDDTQKTGGWYNTHLTVTLSVKGEENDYTINYRVNDGDWKTYSFPIELEDGEHTISYYAVDEAGNREIEMTEEYKIDTRADDTEAYTDISLQNGFYTKQPRITLRSSGDGVIYYRWDEFGDYYTYNGPINPPSAEGNFRLYYYSVDQAGNTEELNSMPLLVDSIGPEVECSNKDIAEKGEIVTFDMSNTTDGIGVESYYVNFGDGSESGWVEDPVVEHRYESSGIFEVVIKARDEAGHESDPETREIEITRSDDSMAIILPAAIVGGVVLLIIAILLILIIVKRPSHHHQLPSNLPPGHPIRAPDNQITRGQFHSQHPPPQNGKKQLPPRPARNNLPPGRSAGQGAPVTRGSNGQVSGSGQQGPRNVGGAQQSVPKRPNDLPPDVPKPPKPPQIPPPPKNPT